ncbi:hypothetical protein FCM35_KLT01645 [Carex littledalei]|uniref:Uncharacterized protein n=1 Tax=Carex littledalei TaxID=544730 RepID=A0A833R295_9POAL|nr:hypothetical protein FCM35_KLT01645 [Carex littledalei]
MGISKDSDHETRIGPTSSDVTINVPDELSRLNQPLLTPLPRANPDPLDAITIVPVELAKVESRYGIILSLIAFTLIPAFFESIYHTTSHVKPLIVIFAVTSYVSLLVTAWHKMRFLRAEPNDVEMVYISTGFFILEVVLFSILITFESLTLPSVPCAFEICWTVLGFVITSCVLLEFKFYG